MTAVPPSAAAGVLGLPATPSGADERRRLEGRKPLEVAREFEALLLGQVLSAMRRTIPESGLLGASAQRRMLDGAFDHEVARALAAGGHLGIAEQITRQITGAGVAAAPAGQRAAAASEGSRAIGSVGPSGGGIEPSGRVPTGGVASAVELRAPVEGHITSTFGLRRDPFTGEPRVHHGMDVAVPEGTPIRAAADGEVVYSGWRGDGGRVVQVRHADGLVTTYAHAQRTLVSVGDRVAAGDVLATVGSSGRSTGPHLHFAVSRNGQPLDPASFLSRESESAATLAGASDPAART